VVHAAAGHDRQRSLKRVQLSITECV
jgi:hypothetical protein